MLENSTLHEYPQLSYPKSGNQQRIRWQYSQGVDTVPSNSFSEAATETLQHYVYRLVDPRNGETFYVGRGQGDRVFQHVGGSIRNAGVDELDP